MTQTLEILPSRTASIAEAGKAGGPLRCGKTSVAGSVSQRACVFCGSRVVLYPIADALHIVHGPIGCAAYTWDIRGAQSSGPQLFRQQLLHRSPGTGCDLRGEKKLERALLELIAKHKPKAAFVYGTCIVGLIGDDVAAVCKRVSEATGLSVLPVASEGFKGTKKDGYKAACEALHRLIGTGDTTGISPLSINLMGDFNIAGESWVIREYFERMGIQVVATITAMVGSTRSAAATVRSSISCNAPAR
jgi:nitrogenase molybdenum-cofactor synthesis protein NifE